MIIHTHIESPLGPLLLTSEDAKLTGLYFADQPHARNVSGSNEQEDAEIFLRTKKQLEEYAAGTRKRFDLPLALAGPRGGRSF